MTIKTLVALYIWILEFDDVTCIRSIGHFRDAASLCFKTRPSANKTNFHKKGFALGLVLRAKVFGTRKWPISLWLFGLLTCPDSQCDWSEHNKHSQNI